MSKWYKLADVTPEKNQFVEVMFTYPGQSAEVFTGHYVSRTMDDPVPPCCIPCIAEGIAMDKGLFVGDPELLFWRPL